MALKVLISGGGVAGLAAAFFLEKRGAEVTVLERAHAYAPLGHYIALKSHGIALVRQMGLLDVCRARELRMRTVQMRTTAGHLLKETPSEALAAAIDGYLLFRRADLHAALFEGAKAHCDVRFGSTLERVTQRPDGIDAVIAGRIEAYDLLLGADGIHSQTRTQVFGDGFMRPMGGRYLALTVDVHHGLPLDSTQVFWGRGQQVALMPNSPDRISAIVYHADGGIDPQGKTIADYRTFFAQAYSEFAPAVQQVFGALGSQAFVFSDTIAQVIMPNIVSGRVALLGDAAHCPTFMSGMGSSLALQGAHALATSLEASGGDVAAGLSQFERVISPIALGYQRSARAARPVLLSRSRIVQLVRNAVVRAIPNSLLTRQAKLFYRTSAAPK